MEGPQWFLVQHSWMPSMEMDSRLLKVISTAIHETSGLAKILSKFQSTGNRTAWSALVR